MKTAKFVVPQMLSPYAAYKHFAPLCAELTPVTCTADLPVVQSNIDAAFRAIEPHLAKLPQLLPQVDLPFVLELPNLVRGALYAAGRVTAVASSGELADKLVQARRTREPMLLIAEGLAALPEPLLPPDRVAKIRAGNGAYDTARDLTDLVGLYREFAEKVHHKHPFDETWLTKAEALGVLLQQAITPDGAVRPIEAKKGDAARVRDQLWAAVLQRDAKLRVIARVLFEGEADVVVPPLQSRTVARKAEVVVVTDPLAPTPLTPTQGAPRKTVPKPRRRAR